jgi:PilZ domain
MIAKKSLGDLIERRAVARQKVSFGGVKLVSKEGMSQSSRDSGRLVDISEKGAGILTGPLPPRQDVIWIGLVGLPSRWIKATVRGIRPAGRQWFYHLEFFEPCPSALLEFAAQRCSDELILMW